MYKKTTILIIIFICLISIVSGKIFLLDGYIMDVESQPVSIISSFFKVDQSTQSIQTIDYAHHEIHAGNHFKAGYGDITQTLDTGETISLLFITPNTDKFAHWTLVSQSTGFAKIEVFENATASNNGNLVTIWNRNRNSLNNSTTLVYHTPTIVSNGTKMITKYIGGVAFKSDIGGESRGDSEFILKKNTKYLIKGTSLTDGISLQVGGDWYEHMDNE